MLLAIDAGNTRVKWGVHDGAGWVVQASAGYDELAQIAISVRKFRVSGPVVISNVAGANIQTALQAVLDELGWDAHWITSQAHACGVSNGYAQPAQLGSDRWVALIAAWNLTRSACVLASAGTALTVDALSSRGEFLGGLIVPGLSMMKTALNLNTAGIAHTDGRLADFPISTGDAVHSGVIAAMAGAVERMCRMLTRREGAEPKLLLTGGDAAVLHDALSGHGAIMDNLVLDGLVLLAGELNT